MERPSRIIRQTLVRPKLSLGIVPTVPYYLLIAVVTWFVLVPKVWISVPCGGVVFVAMWIATAHDPHWFEIFHQRLSSYLWRLIRTRGRSRFLRKYKSAR